MPVEFRVKLAKIGNSLRATIPKPLVEGLRLKKGDILLLTATDSQIVIRKAGARRGKQKT